MHSMDLKLMMLQGGVHLEKDANTVWHAGLTANDRSGDPHQLPLAGPFFARTGEG